MAKYYITLLNQQQMVSKHRGKLSKGILFQDNAASHNVTITLQNLADLRFEVQKHLASTLELAPLGYYLFPNLKKHLSGWKF
jgi:hypothetical protein